MDRDKSTKTSQEKKSSLLCLLTRRSTKVEPQPNHVSDSIGYRGDGGSNSHPLEQSVSAHSSPINQFRQNKLRRHSSTQNISTLSTESHDVLEKSNKAINYNRFSHQFSLCCSVDDRMSTPPVFVRYDDPKQMSTNIVGQTEACNGDVIHKIVDQKPPPLPQPHHYQQRHTATVHKQPSESNANDTNSIKSHEKWSFQNKTPQ